MNISSPAQPVTTGSLAPQISPPATATVLQETERMLSNLLANLPGMAYRCRMDDLWTMEFVSEGCRELTGYSPSDVVLNKTIAFAQLVHPEDRPAVQAETEAAVQADRRYHISYRIRTASGAEKWISEQGLAVRDGNGKVLALEGIMTDITEHKSTEMRIRAFSDLGFQLSAARTPLEAAETMVEAGARLLPCEACSVQIYSEKTDRMHHVLHQDTINGVRRKTIPAQTIRPPSALARMVLREGGQLVLKRDPSKPAEGGQPFGNDQRPSASIILAPIRNGPQVIGMVSVHSYSVNAYDQRSLETLQALADHCGGAWNRIQSQEAVYALEEQLRQSQKMDAIGQLAGGVAHDFNNLLTVMRGNADLALLDAGGLSASACGCLEQIIAATERAATLTRQLLVFSRKQVIQAGPIDLNEVIANLTRMLARIIGEDIKLHCDYDESPGTVHADAGMIEQILVNLAVNARDAMPAGGLLEIKTRTVILDASAAGQGTQARAGRFACVTVSDSGSGIAPEHLPRIFEPFFTTKEAGKGTGLGLATVYGIVKQHQGWIDVSSQPGKGATFSIYFPALEAAQATPRTSPAQEPVRAGTETILLVEDEQEVRVISRRVLKMNGYNVLEAAAGPEALNLWREHKDKIALLLTDVVMPEGIGGGDLAEQLKAEKPDLKIILVSGYSPALTGKSGDFFARVGANFLQKPCSSRLLLDTVRRVLDGH
jgi:PAS domain S-box-containing protein